MESEPTSEGADAKASAKKSFWKRVPVIWTAVIGVIGTVSAIVQGMPKFLASVTEVIATIVGLFGGSISTVPPTPKIEVKALEVLPQSLLNFMGSQDFLNWFSVKVKNEGREPLHVVFEAEVATGPAKEDKVRAEYTVYPGRELTKTINPPIKFLRNDLDADTSMSVIWRINNASQVRLGSDTVPIRVLPKNALYWDMKSLDGGPVPKDFMLASMTAWMLTKDPAVKKRAQVLLHGVPSGADPAIMTRWFERCYSELLHGARAIRISLAENTFPLSGRQIIRTPWEVLEQGRANPVEAALLVAALKTALDEEIGGRLVLFAMPRTKEQPGAKTFLLSWSTPENDWQAIDMTEAASTSFADNQARATPRVTGLLTDRPSVLASLDARGVFIEKGNPVVALDFARAASYFQVRALP